MTSPPKESARECRLHKRNFQRFGLDLNPVVSCASSACILVFAVFALTNLETAQRLMQSLQALIVGQFDWVFILSSNFFVLVCLFLAFSRAGSVKIGEIDGEPEFSLFAWYSMLISAGMGIGLLFWAVGEPLTHVSQAPPIFASDDPAATAMATTFYHWGLHPWGVYALLGLGLAYFSFNKKLPLSLRSVFYPLLKEKIYGPAGDLIDTFAVLATMLGLATSLGLGTQQINSGLSFLLGIPEHVGIQVVLILVITAFAGVSVLAGIHKGVRFLSELNIRLAFVFMMLIFLLGPTGEILRLFSNSLGLYAGNVVQYASWLTPRDASSWQGDWTIFYLAWWISWSPFVGMFIARISRGRTIREFILGVLIVPTLLSFFWLTVFGGTAFHVDAAAGGALYGTVRDNYPVALYEMIALMELPLVPFLGGALAVLVTLLVVSYFITSSDSGSLVVDKLTSGGVMGTPRKQRLFWALLEGLLAATLLLIGGDAALEALQTGVISAGLPLAILLCGMSVSLIRGVNETYREQSRILEKRKIESLLRTDRNGGSRGER